MPIYARPCSTSRDLHNKVTDVHVLPSFSSSCSSNERRKTVAYARRDSDYWLPVDCSCSDNTNNDCRCSPKVRTPKPERRKRPFFALAFALLVALLVARISLLFLLTPHEVTIQSVNDGNYAPTATPASIHNQTTFISEEERDIQNSVRAACVRDEQVLCRRSSCGETYDPFLSILTPGASLAVDTPSKYNNNDDDEYDIPSSSSPSEYCSIPPKIEAHVHEGLTVPFTVLEEAKIESQKLQGVCLDYKDPNSHWTYQWCHGSSFVRTRPDIFSSSIQETEDFGLFRLARVGVHAESLLRNGAGSSGGSFLRNSISGASHRVAREALLDGLVVRQYFDSHGDDEHHHRHRAVVELRCCRGQSSEPSFLSVNTDTYNDETAADALICAPALCINHLVDDQKREIQEKKLETNALKHLIDTVLDAMNNTSATYFPEQSRVRETLDPVVNEQNMKSQKRLVDMVLHSLVEILTDDASYERSPWATTQNGYQDTVALVMQTSDMTHDQYDFIKGKYTRNGLLKLIKAMLTYKPKKWGRLTVLLSESVERYLNGFHPNLFVDEIGEREQQHSKNVFRDGGLGRTLNVFDEGDRPSDADADADADETHNVFAAKQDIPVEVNAKEHSNVFSSKASSETEATEQGQNQDVRHMEDPKDNLSDPLQNDDSSANGEAFVLNAFEDADVNQCLSYHEQAQTLLSDNCISAFNTARKQMEGMNSKNKDENLASDESTNDEQRSNRQWIAEIILLAVTFTSFTVLTAIAKMKQTKVQPSKSSPPNERPSRRRPSMGRSSSARFSRRSLMHREDTIKHMKLHSFSDKPSLTELRNDEDGSDDDSTANNSSCSQGMQRPNCLVQMVVLLNVVALGMFLFKALSIGGYLDFLIVSMALIICHSCIIGESKSD